jgi:hypothetical protein
MKRETKFPWWGWVGILCLLPVLYVLSIFPVVWISVNYKLAPPVWLANVYDPVFWAANEWEWFGRPLEWIFERLGIT